MADWTVGDDAPWWWRAFEWQDPEWQDPRLVDVPEPLLEHVAGVRNAHPGLGWGTPGERTLVEAALRRAAVARNNPPRAGTPAEAAERTRRVLADAPNRETKDGHYYNYSAVPEEENGDFPQRMPNAAHSDPCHWFWWRDLPRDFAWAAGSMAPAAMIGPEMDPGDLRELLERLSPGSEAPPDLPALNRAHELGIPLRALVHAAVNGPPCGPYALPPAPPPPPRRAPGGRARGRGGGPAGRAAEGRRDVARRREAPVPYAPDPDYGGWGGPRETAELAAVRAVRTCLAIALRAVWRCHLARERRARLAAPLPRGDNANEEPDDARADLAADERARRPRNRNGRAPGDAAPPARLAELIAVRALCPPAWGPAADAAVLALGAKFPSGGLVRAIRVFNRAREDGLRAPSPVRRGAPGGGRRGAGPTAAEVAEVVRYGLAARAEDLVEEAMDAWEPLAEWAWARRDEKRGGWGSGGAGAVLGTGPERVVQGAGAAAGTA